MSVADRAQSRPGVTAFYRALSGSAAGWLAAHRFLLAVVVEVGLIAACYGLRTADAPRLLLLAWTATLGGLAVVAPTSAVVVLAAVVPFSEWLVFNDVGAKVLIVAALGVGLVLRAVLRGGSFQLPPALRWGALVLATTAASIVVTAINLRPITGDALVAAVNGIGGGVVAMGAAFAAGRAGSTRPVWAAVLSVAVGAAASLTDFLLNGLVRSSAFDWMLRPLRLELPRVTGIIPAPNAVATVAVAALAVVVARAVAGPGRVRVALLVIAAVLAVTTILTYSRSGLAGMFVILLLLVASRRPRLALALAAVGFASAVVALPAYLRFRTAALGSGDISDLTALLTGDAYRLEGWLAAVRMFADAPLTGLGAMSFKELAAEYGSTYVTAPHNELLRLLAEGGIGAGAAFVGFAFVTGRDLWRNRSPLALGGLGALAALLIGGSFNNPFIYIQVMVPVFVIIGGALAVAEGTRARAGGAQLPMPSQPSTVTPSSATSSTATSPTAPHASTFPTRPLR